MACYMLDKYNMVTSADVDTRLKYSTQIGLCTKLKGALFFLWEDCIRKNLICTGKDRASSPYVYKNIVRKNEKFRRKAISSQQITRK